MSKEFTFTDIAAHATKKDLYVVIHEKVYNASTFIDEHPGGEEVLLDVAGQDATEAFEDVGHSDEAREILSGLLIGDLKRLPGDASPNIKTAPATSTSTTGGVGLGIGLYAVLLLGGVAAFGAYKYMEAQKGKA